MDKKQKTIEIRPQLGPQENFLASSADIVIFGGAAGGGKTFALLLESIRHYKTKGFGGIIFRRTIPQISSEGGLWDTARELYPLLKGKMTENPYRITFPFGSKIEFRGLQYEKNVFDFQGAQIPFIAFDELTHFTWKMFTYLISRNRSTCGIKPYIRATCNPDPDSWVANFISWYIDQDTGYAIPERSGVIRYFVIQNDQVIWGETKKELVNFVELSDEAKREGFKKEDLIKSFTFIPSSIYDNQILLTKDPGYLANLNALPTIEKEQLLKGNWKIKYAAGDYFKKEWFDIVRHPAKKMKKIIRYWDRAATEPSIQNTDPDWTVGLKMGLGEDGLFYIIDLVRFRGRPEKVLKAIKFIAAQDGEEVEIWVEEDPGQAGKMEASYIIKKLAGYNVYANRVTKNKIIRAKPLSSQCEAGNVIVVKGKWNLVFFNELESFPPEKNKGHDDIVDASSGAFNMLIEDEVNDSIDYELFLAGV
jgi:predicted phage terminase large subunit-like protein